MTTSRILATAALLLALPTPARAQDVKPFPKIDPYTKSSREIWSELRAISIVYSVE